MIAHLNNQAETHAALRANGTPDRLIPQHFDVAFHTPANVTRLCMKHEIEFTKGLIAKRDVCAARRVAVERRGPLPFLRFVYDEARANQRCRNEMAQMYCLSKISEFWRAGWRESPSRFLIAPTRREAMGFHQHFDITEMGGESLCGDCPHCCERQHNIPRWVPTRRL